MNRQAFAEFGTSEAARTCKSLQECNANAFVELFVSDSSMPASYERRRSVARALLAIFYIVAGYFHLASPNAFISVTPAWVPYPHAVILVTGLAELAGVLALLVPRTLCRFTPSASTRPMCGTLCRIFQTQMNLCDGYITRLASLLNHSSSGGHFTLAAWLAGCAFRQRSTNLVERPLLSNRFFDLNDQ
jgi:uncharacterized membrane protein